ncbi:MAG: response regulator [Puniceicoccaceae bacterium]
MDSSESKNKCSVLLAEDNKINQKLVQLMLAKFHLKGTIAESGQEAVEMAKSNPYDIILMDLHMPGMDGVEATRILKEELGDKCPPILALTADVQASSKGNALVDGWLTKPINTETLKASIEEHTGITF